MIRAMIAVLLALMLSGCSGLSVLSGLDDKPDLTAQVGAENVKQTVGVTAKQDTSSKQETTIKESKVDKVDTSSKKQVKTSTIQAQEIKAEHITVNGGDTFDDLIVTIFAALCFFFGGFLTGKLTNKKGA